ncbi:hypothetical protein BKA67DRAFT_543169 [Truncatella angustata]|uniref:Zn(2)-C6 fungal-type domain-containing protein n=1 Tax=Truncatella angustata TaxID=152316 RepID=A0A9P8UVA0_9PEZI|nr:uncharacterized protein BKA67DRAFT_543169 [Truncatella angustata]KAH6658992.1 hypothetical protein BKA67DRAFT_543169 [Truncatella angustata]
MSGRGFANSQSISPVAKRSACDRCRSQKLRCTPGPDGNTSCARCIHLGTECSKNYPRLMGFGGKVSDGIDIRARAPGCHSPQSGHQLPGFASLASTYPPPRPSIGTHSQVDVQYELPTNITEEHLLANVSDYGSIFSDTSILFDAVQMENMEDTMNDINSPIHGARSNTASPGRNMDLIRAPHPKRRPSRTSDGHSVSEMSEKGPSLDHDTRLRRLGMSLLQQQKQHQILTSSATHNNAGEADQEEDAMAIAADRMPLMPENETSFGEALAATSEFSSILRSYNTTNFTSQSASRSVLSVVVTLDVMSAYLQIIDIHENLFAGLHQQLCTSAGQLTTSLQTLPGLSLAGFAVEQGSLQTKILLQAVIHQFETIERILGLPVELRVSNRKDTYMVGLLDGEWGRNLVKALMGSVLSQNDLRGMSKLDSLRRNIENVKRFLEL